MKVWIVEIDLMESMSQSVCLVSQDVDLAKWVPDYFGHDTWDDVSAVTELSDETDEVREWRISDADGDDLYWVTATLTRVEEAE